MRDDEYDGVCVLCAHITMLDKRCKLCGCVCTQERRDMCQDELHKMRKETET